MNTPTPEAASPIPLNDRIDIFRQLNVDDLRTPGTASLFEGLMTIYYDDFVKFCDDVEASPNRDSITGISCYIKNERIYFDVTHA